VARGTVNECFTLEKDLRNAAILWARARGWFVRRYKGPGRRSHPDDMFVCRGVVLWIEAKLPGKEPTELQWREIREMRRHGCTVYWIDSLDDYKAVLKAHERVL
jgi:hypothetical protein